MKVSEYTKDLYDLLDISSFLDISLNGIQIGGDDREIKKVAFAVDACYETIDKAVKENADILVVHHGLFWGEPISITGSHYKRVKRAIEGDLTLFACHLPLDANVPYGNNYQIAEKLGIENGQMFSKYKGREIGIIGDLPYPMTPEEIRDRLFSPKAKMTVIPGSKKEKFERVGIVSGGGSDSAMDALNGGADALITGEVKHEDYHGAVESGISIVALGHYQTETFGVKALEEYTHKKYGLETVFIESETGL